MSSLRSQRIFFRRVGEALSPYQLLEAFLKIYIQRAHLRIERFLVGKVPFHYPASEYENAPLERLITMFQRHRLRFIQHLCPPSQLRSEVRLKRIFFVRRSIFHGSRCQPFRPSHLYRPSARGHHIQRQETAQHLTTRCSRRLAGLFPPFL